MESETEIIEYIRAGKLALPPLCFSVQSAQVRPSDIQPDVLLDTTWQGKTYSFVGEVKRYSSDKSVNDAAERARLYAQTLKINPLVIVPWLSNEQLQLLERKNVSGIDLCGNGVVVVPGEVLVLRSGQPNKYPTTRLIRRVYEGTSSLVARVLLLRSEYSSLSDILDEVTKRGGSITLPTISKALKQLEEDVVIEKSRERIRLLQPDKVLDRLAANYQAPNFRGFVRAKLSTRRNTTIGTTLQKVAEAANERIVLSGQSSVNFYATMGKEPIDLFYCTEITTLPFEKFGAELDVFSRFPNVELRKADSETVFFDNRYQSGYYVASPIQTYLELFASDKRGQETAEQVRRKILDDLAQIKRKRSK